MVESRKPPLLKRRRAPVQGHLPLPEPVEPGWVGDAVEPRELPWWQRRQTVFALAALTLLLFVWAVAAQLAARRERQAATELRQQVRTLTLRPTSTQRGLRIVPNNRSWSASPDAVVSWPEPPELVELFLPVAYAAPFGVFAITIDKVDQGRVLVLQRVVPDSNKDLRVSLNSSAFGPGEYRIKLQGYTWRGQRTDVGWVRLIVSG